MEAGPQANKFGQFLVENLRDPALEFLERLAQSRSKSRGTRALQKALAKMSPEQREVIQRCIVAAVDSGIAHFLFALGEAHDFKKGIAVIVDGKNIVDQSDGLHGEIFSKEGWFARFSKHGEQADVL